MSCNNIKPIITKIEDAVCKNCIYCFCDDDGIQRCCNTRSYETIYRTTSVLCDGFTFPFCENGEWLVNDSDDGGVFVEDLRCVYEVFTKPEQLSKKTGSCCNSDRDSLGTETTCCKSGD